MSPVIVQQDGALGRLSLNRPEALHALNLEMVTIMTEALLAWMHDPSIGAVLIDHAHGTRGFCAGGDIRMLARSGAGDGAQARAFFHAEYQLNHLSHVYPKPVVALMDGVTMGGGVGISVHNLFRIATDATTFAMPETGIGLFPDVGGGWFLPRLPGAIGTWLALTGARLKAADCKVAGIATHCIPTELLGAVRAQIAGAASAHDPAAALASGLDALDEAIGRPGLLTPENLARINAAFSADTMEAIIAALETDGTDWAGEQLAILHSKSPQTLKLALAQLRAGASMDRFEDVMAMEYAIGSRVIHCHDFQEGVRAVIIDKDNAPVWNPGSLETVSDGLIAGLMAPLSPEACWTPLPEVRHVAAA
ncbi:MAG: enoyl-CoA hydratase/isomerase family protein [Hyphomonadaceae bacterium]|nr:enoyl-CoA hydratase/isomerase family protein [Hyphomonadaceae bacterium]